jgi:hypothetical protein
VTGLRQLAVALLVAIGIMALEVAGSAWLVSRTLLDADRFARDATAALQSPAGVNAIVDLAEPRVEAALASRGLPAPHGLDPLMQRAVSRTMSQPGVDLILESAVRQVHAAVLSDHPPPDLTVDLGGLSDPLANTIGEENPRLGTIVRRSVRLGAVRLGHGRAVAVADRLGEEARTVRRLPAPALAIGLVALGAALLIAIDRARTSRRVGVLLLVAAAWPAVVGLAMPWLVGRLVGGSEGSLASDLAGRVVDPWWTVTVLFAVAGAALIVAGVVFSRPAVLRR